MSANAAKTTAKDKSSKSFTDEERDAMQARAKELKAQARASKSREDGERDILAAITAMPEADRALGERLHAVITASAPGLFPKTWYGMPAYANQDGKIVCFFQGAYKFKARYATLGFNDVAKLDEGTCWPTAFALTALTPDDEARLSALVKQAVE